jgi:HEAT repeat protein
MFSRFPARFNWKLFTAIHNSGRGHFLARQTLWMRYLPNLLHCPAQGMDLKAGLPCRERQARCTEPRRSVPFRETQQNARIALMVWWNTLRLKSSSPEVRRKALEALDATGNERNFDLLLAGLGDEDAQVRCTAVNRLEQVRDDQAMVALVSALQDPTSSVRETAAAALGRLGDSRTFPHLAYLLSDSHPGVRTAAATSLRNLGWKPSTNEEQARFDIALGHTRAAAFAGQAAVKALVSELKQDTSFKRRAAAEALEQVDDPQATQPLLATLKDEDPTVRVSAIHALGKDPSGQVTMKVLECFHDKEPCVRLAAAEVIAKRIDPALIPEFLGLLSDRSFEVRLSAVQFLGRIRDPEIAQALLPLLADSDNDVRQGVAQALGTIGEPAAIEALVLAMTDEERAVRHAAEMALARIDPNWICSEAAQRAAPQLEAALNDQRGWVRSAAAQVLAKLHALNALPSAPAWQAP